MSKYDAYGEIKVECDHRRVETLTLDGWQLIEILFCDESDSVWDNCSSCNSTVRGEVRVFRRPMFVFGKQPDDLRTKWSAKVASLNEELTKVKDEYNDVKNKYHTLQNQYGTLECDNKHTTELYNEAVSATIKLRKLTQHFGEKVIREALGEEEEQE